MHVFKALPSDWDGRTPPGFSNSGMIPVVMTMQPIDGMPCNTYFYDPTVNVWFGVGGREEDGVPVPRMGPAIYRWRVVSFPFPFCPNQRKWRDCIGPFAVTFVFSCSVDSFFRRASVRFTGEREKEGRRFCENSGRETDLRPGSCWLVFSAISRRSLTVE